MHHPSLFIASLLAIGAAARPWDRPDWADAPFWGGLGRVPNHRSSSTARSSVAAATITPAASIPAASVIVTPAAGVSIVSDAPDSGDDNPFDPDSDGTTGDDLGVTTTGPSLSSLPGTLATVLAASSSKNLTISVTINRGNATFATSRVTPIFSSTVNSRVTSAPLNSSQQPKNQQKTTASSTIQSKQAEHKPTSTTGSTVSTGTSSGSGAKASTYQEIVVVHHNFHRANHSAPDLAWDAKLASTAQKIAASCNYAHNTQMDGGGYGQNIAAGVKPDNVSAVITDLFYNGELPYFAKLYGQQNPASDMTSFEHWGHFSQVVWKKTNKVGCYTQDCSAKGLGGVGSGVSPFFTVCNYGPPGNYANEYADNVGKPLGKPTIGWAEGLADSALKGIGIGY